MSDSKIYVTNNTSATIELPLKSGGFQVIEPGETEGFVPVDPKSAQIVGWSHAGAIAVSDEPPKKTESARDAAPKNPSAGSTDPTPKSSGKTS